MSEQNLNQIVSSFYVTDIQNTPLLFNKESGEVSSINNSAALLINLAQTGLSDKEIISEISDVHSVSKNQILEDLEDLKSYLVKSEHAEEAGHDDNQMPIENFEAKPCSETSESEAICFYKAGNIKFQVSYPDSETCGICHSILSSLSIPSQTHVDEVIEVVEGLNGWAIFLNGKGQNATEDYTSVADILRTVILDTIGAKLGSWIGLHAAGVLTSEKEVLLFAAPSGSGKSTLAIELMLQGYGYLGDDTQILDLEKQEVWPFPTSANLKPGSWSQFNNRLPELKEINTFRTDTRPVKFLPVKLDLDTVNNPYKTRALIFPEYADNAEGSIEKVDLSEQIRLLSESGCYSKVKASSEMSQKYMEYMLSIDSYQLKYDSSEQAIKLLRSISLLD